MKEIYFIIKDLLKALNTFKYIDFDYGQGDIPNPPLQYPAALINITLPKCDDVAGQDQQCRAIITIRMFWNFTGETASIYPDARIETALSYFDDVNAVHGVLQAFTNDELGRLSRLNLIPEKRGDGLKVVNMPYETYFEDVVE